MDPSPDPRAHLALAGGCLVLWLCCPLGGVIPGQHPLLPISCADTASPQACDPSEKVDTPHSMSAKSPRHILAGTTWAKVHTSASPCGQDRVHCPAGHGRRASARSLLLAHAAGSAGLGGQGTCVSTSFQVIPMPLAHRPHFEEQRERKTQGAEEGRQKTCPHTSPPRVRTHTHTDA